MWTTYQRQLLPVVITKVTSLFLTPLDQEHIHSALGEGVMQTFSFHPFTANESYQFGNLGI